MGEAGCRWVGRNRVCFKVYCVLLGPFRCMHCNTQQRPRPRFLLDGVSCQPQTPPLGMLSTRHSPGHFIEIVLWPCCPFAHNSRNQPAETVARYCIPPGFCFAIVGFCSAPVGRQQAALSRVVLQKQAAAAARHPQLPHPRAGPCNGSHVGTARQHGLHEAPGCQNQRHSREGSSPPTKPPAAAAPEVVVARQQAGSSHSSYRV